MKILISISKEQKDLKKADPVVPPKPKAAKVKQKAVAPKAVEPTPDVKSAKPLKPAAIDPVSVTERNVEPKNAFTKHIVDTPVRDKTTHLITEKEVKEKFKQKYGNQDPRAVLDRVMKEQEVVEKNIKKRKPDMSVRKRGQTMVLDYDTDMTQTHGPQNIFNEVYHK